MAQRVLGQVALQQWRHQQVLGYLDNSRNLEVVMRSEAMAKRIGQLHEQLWDGPYAKALDVTADYPAPHPGQP